MAFGWVCRNVLLLSEVPGAFNLNPTKCFKWSNVHHRPQCIWYVITWKQVWIWSHITDLSIYHLTIYYNGNYHNITSQANLALFFVYSKHKHNLLIFRPLVSVCSFWAIMLPNFYVHSGEGVPFSFGSDTSLPRKPVPNCFNKIPQSKGMHGISTCMQETLLADIHFTPVIGCFWGRSVHLHSQHVHAPPSCSFWHRYQTPVGQDNSTLTAVPF